MLSSRTFTTARTSRTLLESLRTSSAKRPFSMLPARALVGKRLSPLPKPCSPRLVNYSPSRLFSSTPRTFAEVKPEDPNARPPWIDVLEGVANGPWLHTTIPDEPLRLAVAHGLMYQLLLYLSRPIDGVNMHDASKNEDGGTEGQISDAHAQYLSAFAVARVPPTSEMGRARIATAKLVSGVLHQLTSIPSTSPLRTEHTDLFEGVQRLKELAEKELKDGGKSGEMKEGAEWKDFWGHAQPIVVELAQFLSEKGFMLEKEGEGGESKH